MQRGELLYVTVPMEGFSCRVGIKLGIDRFEVIGQESTPLHGMDLSTKYGPGSVLPQIESACRTWFVARNLETRRDTERACKSHSGVVGEAVTSRPTKGRSVDTTKK
jgi:hypothetical protein